MSKRIGRVFPSRSVSTRFQKGKVYCINGVVTDISERTETDVYNEISYETQHIRTKHYRIQKIWIQFEDGDSVCWSFTNKDFDLRPGHPITVVFMNNKSTPPPLSLVGSGVKNTSLFIVNTEFQQGLKTNN